MQVKLLETAGLESALAAMRLPMKSGDKSDSGFCYLHGSELCNHCPNAVWTDDPADMHCECEKSNFYAVGPADYKLSAKLTRAGASHRKHLRLIDAWLEIRAPRYWWAEFDTYRYGVDKVSESTMHRLLLDEITEEDFEGIGTVTFADFKDLADALKKDIGFGIYSSNEALPVLKRNLPESYLQTRICKCSYEALHNMYQERKNHRLPEWQFFCKALKDLPYSEWITEETSN